MCACVAIDHCPAAARVERSRTTLFCAHIPPLVPIIPGFRNHLSRTLASCTLGFVLLTPAPEILRHGKHAAGADNHQHASPVQASAPLEPVKATAPVSAADGIANNGHGPEVSRDVKSQTATVEKTTTAQREVKTHDYRQEAEKIVAEEKLQGERMPSYEVGFSCQSVQRP